MSTDAATKNEGLDDLLDGLRIERQRTAPAAHDDTPRRLAGWRLGPRGLAAALAVLLLGGAAAMFALATRSLTVETATAEAAESGGGAPGLTAGGYVRAARIVYVAPKVAGRISELLVREGDEVSAGQVVARIETRDLAQEAVEAQANRDLAQATLEKLTAGARPEEVAEAKARLEAVALARAKAERELARAKALFDQGILSVQALDLAQTEFQIADRTLASVQQSASLVEAGPRAEEIRAARAALRAAEARLHTAGNRMSDAQVRAPIAGRVLRKFRNVGDFVSPELPHMESYETVAVGSPVVALTDLGPQEVSADINETDIARVALRQPVEVVPNAYPQLVLRGSVSQVSPRADRNKNTIEVKVTLDRTTTVLPYDAGVKLTFVDPAPRTGSTAVRVPSAALLDRSGKALVFVVTDGRARLREVQLGSREEAPVTITSGLSEGERVAVSNLDRLEDGSRVSPK